MLNLIIWNKTSLASLPGPLWFGTVVPDKGSIYGLGLKLTAYLGETQLFELELIDKTE